MVAPETMVVLCLSEPEHEHFVETADTQIRPSSLIKELTNKQTLSLMSCFKHNKYIYNFIRHLIKYVFDKIFLLYSEY